MDTSEKQLAPSSAAPPRRRDMPANAHPDIPVQPASLALVLSRVGVPLFGEAVLDLLAAHVRHDAALILYYRRIRQPNLVCDRFTGIQRPQASVDAMRHSYRLDPVYRFTRTLEAPAVCRTRDLVDEDFEQADYYRFHHRFVALADEINVLLPVEDGRVFAISLERDARGPVFSSGERQFLETWLPFMQAAFVLHRRLSPELIHPEEDGEDAPPDMAGALSTFGTGLLTQREYEVCHALLSGWSAQQIAKQLDVSVETVRVHRRNIYAKLEVSSLAELFAAAFRTVEQVIRAG